MTHRSHHLHRPAIGVYCMVMGEVCSEYCLKYQQLCVNNQEQTLKDQIPGSTLPCHIVLTSSMYVCKTSMVPSPSYHKK